MDMTIARKINNYILIPKHQMCFATQLISSNIIYLFDTIIIIITIFTYKDVIQNFINKLRSK